MSAANVLPVLEYFGNPEMAYYADPEEYQRLQLSAGAQQSLLEKNMDGAERVLAECDRLGLRIMTLQDADYPDRLRQLADPPAVLYIRGRVFAFDEEVAIGVVGARDPSGYGRYAAEKFGMELATGGALVVSGIAQGLDSCAITGALKGGGSVVSVLAGGVDVVFPRQNRYLYEDVAAAGALISESPPGTPHKGNLFPLRNRVLSGLCLGVLAVECRTFGGTMNTMNHALEQNRDLFAVPGAIHAPLSEGTNRLIQQGAKLVTCGRDILEEYYNAFPQKLLPSTQLPPEAVEARLSESSDSSVQSDQGEEAPALGDKAQKLPEDERPAHTQDKPPERKKIPREQQKAQFTDEEIAILVALGDQIRAVEQVVDLTQIPTWRVLSALTALAIKGATMEWSGLRFSSLVELEE
jgi:DNA processing protein